jgi:hypothetical protein
VAVRLRFGRFLNFSTTVLKADSLPANLTERRFRNARQQTRQAMNIENQHKRVDVVTLQKLAEQIRRDVADPNIHGLNKGAALSIAEIISQSIGAPLMQPTYEQGTRMADALYPGDNALRAPSIGGWPGRCLHCIPTRCATNDDRRGADRASPRARRRHHRRPHAAQCSPPA